MKRMWIGAGLLALLLTAGLLVGAVMEAKGKPGAEKLRQAADAALAEDWETARELTDAARADWDKVQGLAEILAPHESLEQMETAFAQLSAYANVDSASYSALCIALAQQLEGLGKAHECSWRNLF